VANLIKAIDKEVIATLDKMIRGEDPADSADIEGVDTKLDGIRSEYEESSQYQDVTQFGKKPRGPLGEADVDIVAEKGKLRVENKRQNPFDLEKMKEDPDGTTKKVLTDKCADLKRKIERLKSASADPANQVDGQPPRIAVRFTKGVSLEVKLELEKMGVQVDATHVVILPPPKPGSEDKDGDRS
jgi:hypothetical protein